MNVFIEYVLNLAGARARIGFNVDGLHRIVKFDVFEMNSTNTCMLVTWRNRANSSTNTKKHCHVLNVNVLGAAIFSNNVSVVRRLDSYSVIPIGNLNVFNCYVGARRVDTICVQRHRGPRVPLSLTREKEINNWGVIFEEV